MARTRPSLRTPATVIARTAVAPVAARPARAALPGWPLAPRPSGTLRTSLAPVRRGAVGARRAGTVPPPGAGTLVPVPGRSTVLPVAALSPRPTVLPVATARTVPLRTGRAVALRPVTLRTPITPVGAPAGGPVALRTTVLPFATGSAGPRATLPLRTTVPPVRSPGTLRPAALTLGTALRPVTLGTTLRPVPLGTALLRPAAAVLGPATGGPPSLPGALSAATGRASALACAASLRTALSGAATASSGSLTAGTAGASSR
jgi:hypothetical protein